MNDISDALTSPYSTGGGKGDTPRPSVKSKFDAGYDAIFRRCPDHPEYRATTPPVNSCLRCGELWRLAKIER
jgi:hypothetical protein